MTETHEANRRGWDAFARAGKANFSKVDWRKCHLEPALALDERELKRLGDLKGKHVCVLGSGDNRVVFALVGLGANVVSVDISQEQLNIASARAKELGLDVMFLRSDVTDLSALDSDTFDVVYTGGHVAVWVSDLRKYYGEAARILKPGGLFIVNEYHPFRRIWDDSTPSLSIAFPYFDRGPHEWDRSEELPDAEPGSLPQYEYHWTVSEYLAAVMSAGCELLSLDEFGDAPDCWEAGPSLSGLPLNLLIVSRKGGRRGAAETS